jgi:hypothetical protein
MPDDVPAVAISGVAPAIELIAPSDAAAVATDLRIAEIGDEITISSIAATTRTTGVRWSIAINTAVGRLNHASRR